MTVLTCDDPADPVAARTIARKSGFNSPFGSLKRTSTRALLGNGLDPDVGFPVLVFDIVAVMDWFTFVDELRGGRVGPVWPRGPEAWDLGLEEVDCGFRAIEFGFEALPERVRVDLGCLKVNFTAS